MRESILIGSVWNNAESWVNINKTDLINLEKADIILQKFILSEKGNPSKVFMYLELEILPVKYIIMKKGLRYILNEDMSSMIRQVYETLKLDSRKGDLYTRHEGFGFRPHRKRNCRFSQKYSGKKSFMKE